MGRRKRLLAVVRVVALVALLSAMVAPMLPTLTGPVSVEARGELDEATDETKESDTWRSSVLDDPPPTQEPSPKTTTPPLHQHVDNQEGEQENGFLIAEAQSADLTAQSGPVAFPDFYGAFEDQTLTVQTPGVLSNDNVGSGTNLRAVLLGGTGITGGYRGATQQGGSITLLLNGGFTYVPPSGYRGTDTFQYYPWSSVTTGSTVVVTITVTELPPPGPPIGQPDFYTAKIAGTVFDPAPGLLRNDRDGRGALGSSNLRARLQAKTGNSGGYEYGPTHLGGTVYVSPNGEMSYEAPGVWGGERVSGTDWFDYIPASFGIEGEPVRVTIEIVAAPVGNADRYDILRADIDPINGYTIDAPGVLANDTDSGGTVGSSSLRAVLVSGDSSDGVSYGFTTAGNFVGLSENGGFYYSYWNASDIVGTDTFQYTPFENGIAGDPVTVTLNIIGAAPSPPLSPPDVPPTGLADTFTVIDSSFWGVTIDEPGVLANDLDSTGANNPQALRAVLLGDGVTDYGFAMEITPDTGGWLYLYPNGRIEFYYPDSAQTWTGQVTFQYAPVELGVRGEPTTVTVNVISPPDPPRGSPDSYDIPAEVPFDGFVVPAPGVLKNDVTAGGESGTGTLTAKIAGAYFHNGVYYADTDEGGFVGLSEDGGFYYYPPYVSLGLFTGLDTFSYRPVDNGVVGEPVLVTLNVVAPSPSAPVGEPDSYTFTDNRGASVHVDAPGVLANDDADGDQGAGALTAIGAGEDVEVYELNSTIYLTNGGYITLWRDGSFSYVFPNNQPGWLGEISFQYVPMRGAVEGEPVTVTVSVTEPPSPSPSPSPSLVGNPPPVGVVVANPNEFSVDPNLPLNVPAPGVLANDSDLDGRLGTESDTLVAILDPADDVVEPIYFVGKTAEGGNVTLYTDGSFAYEPPENFEGIDSFTYFPIAIPSVMDDFAAESVGVASMMTTGEMLARGETVPVTLLVGDGEPDDPTLPPPPAATGTTIPDRFNVFLGETNTIDAPGVLANDILSPPGSFADAQLYPSQTHVGNGYSGQTTRGGTVVLYHDGGVRYTPPIGLVVGDADTFQYYLTSENRAIAALTTVTLTLFERESAADPLARNDTYDHRIIAGGSETLTVNAPGVLMNDLDFNGDALVARIVAGPTHGTLNRAVDDSAPFDGSFIYTPNPDFRGVDTFSYYACKRDDGDFCSSQTEPAEVTINVTRLVPPIARDDFYVVTEGTRLVAPSDGIPGPWDNDESPNGYDFYTQGLTWSVPSGAVCDGPSFTYAGEFTIEFCPGFVGTVRIQYKISELPAPYLADTAYITIRVVEDPDATPPPSPEVGQPPVPVRSVYTTLRNQPLTVTAPGYLANDYSPNGRALEAIFVGSRNRNTEHGRVALTGTPLCIFVFCIGFAGNGGFTYTPKTDFVGEDWFFYELCETTQQGQCSDSVLGSVKILVIDPDPSPTTPPLLPTGEDDSYDVEAGQTLLVAAPGVLENDDDPNETGLLAYIADLGVEGPANGTLSVSNQLLSGTELLFDGGFTYTPDDGFTGEDGFTYYVCEATEPERCNLDEPVSVTITVLLAALPSPDVSPEVSPSPVESASPAVSPSPTVSPSVAPSATPSGEPTASPTTTPSAEPTASGRPSPGPSADPSVDPSSPVSPPVSPGVSPQPTSSPVPETITLVVTLVDVGNAPLLGGCFTWVPANADDVITACDRDGGIPLAAQVDPRADGVTVLQGLSPGVGVLVQTVAVPGYEPIRPTALVLGPSVPMVEITVVNLVANAVSPSPLPTESPTAGPTSQPSPGATPLPKPTATTEPSPSVAPVAQLPETGVGSDWLGHRNAWPWWVVAPLIVVIVFAGCGVRRKPVSCR